MQIKNTYSEQSIFYHLIKAPQVKFCTNGKIGEVPDFVSS